MGVTNRSAANADTMPTIASRPKWKFMAHNPERAVDGERVFAAAVILQFGVVDKVNGVINGHTQHHGDDCCGHHIKRYAGPTHYSANEYGRHQVRYKSYQSNLYALEGNHQYDSYYQDRYDE